MKNARERLSKLLGNDLTNKIFQSEIIEGLEDYKIIERALSRKTFNLPTCTKCKKELTPLYTSKGELGGWECLSDSFIPNHPEIFRFNKY